jgi:hypothetical protein
MRKTSRDHPCFFTRRKSRKSTDGGLGIRVYRGVYAGETKPYSNLKKSCELGIARLFIKVLLKIDFQDFFLKILLGKAGFRKRKQKKMFSSARQALA